MHETASPLVRTQITSEILRELGDFGDLGNKHSSKKEKQLEMDGDGDGSGTMTLFPETVLLQSRFRLVVPVRLVRDPVVFH